MGVIVCETNPTCMDANVNRWYCMRGHKDAEPGVCPLKRCTALGANKGATQ